MSQTGTPTEFLQLGITEPDDTLNVLVDLNGQWRKIDTGVKNVDTKANTNASGISALNTAVQDNTENITNILETNVNQQTSIDTLQSKVATLEQDDTSYGSRITAVEAGVQENSELINDLEVDLSGVKTSVGTVPSGSTLQGQVDGLDTRVTSLETEVGTVPSGSTVQGQISALDSEVNTLNGQVNSGNIPFRFSVDGGGNYGYLKADDSFVPFFPNSVNGFEIIKTNFIDSNQFMISGNCIAYGTTDTHSQYYKKAFYLPTKELIDLSNTPYIPGDGDSFSARGELIIIGNDTYYYDRNNHTLVKLQNCFCACSGIDYLTYYTKETNQYTLHYIDLLDSTNNLTLAIQLPNDKLQSTTTGKKGMIFLPFEPSLTNTTIMRYITNNNSYVNVIYDGSLHFNEYSLPLQNSFAMYLKNELIYPYKITISGDGVHINSDVIYSYNYYDYVRFGNYFIKTTK